MWVSSESIVNPAIFLEQDQPHANARALSLVAEISLPIVLSGAGRNSEMENESMPVKSFSLFKLSARIKVRCAALKV